MNLYLMRHGDAVPIGGSVQEDAERPLSSLGKTQVKKTAEGLRRHVPVMEGIISSPLKRAVETAQIVAQLFGVKKLDTSIHLEPNASTATSLTLLKTLSTTQHLLLIGHHPNVSILTAFLTGLDPSACPLFGTASIAALQWDSGKSKAEFLWFQTSEQLIQS